MLRFIKKFIIIPILRNRAKNKEKKAIFSTVSMGTWEKAVRLWCGQAQDFLNDLPLRSCPACGENDSYYIYTSYDKHDFHACNNCGCWFEPLYIDEKLFQKFMQNSPEAKELAEKMAQERLTLPSACEADQQRFQELLNFLDCFPIGNLLDIGANAGQFVAQASARGFNAWGLEADSFALAEAVKHGRQVVATANELPSPSIDTHVQQWDMITMWETIEHVVDPYGMLSSMEKKLNPNGVMVFTFPNLNNMHLKQMRGDCIYSHGGYNTPGHINFFGMSQFSTLLKRCGLEAIFWDCLYTSDYASIYGHLIDDPETNLINGISEDKNYSPNSATNSSIVPYLFDHLYPSFAFLEKSHLVAPILLCIACRPEEKKFLNTQINNLQNKRTADLHELKESILRQAGLNSNTK